MPTLIPRSITTPFAMAMSDTIGGAPELIAILVAITGIGGTVVGDVLLSRLGSAPARNLPGPLRPQITAVRPPRPGSPRR